MRRQLAFAPRATPHTKPGVGAGNGSFWGFKKALNKQATAGSSRWGLGCPFFSKVLFSHFFVCLSKNVQF